MWPCHIATAAIMTAPTVAEIAGSNTPPSWIRRLRLRAVKQAAFIFEPVSGATLGAVLSPPGYLQSVAEVCRRRGVLLIDDEVMTGMGRTGRNFAVDHCFGRSGN